MRLSFFVAPFLLLIVGCLNHSETALVTDNPFGYSQPGPIRTKAAYSPASLEAAARVDALGRKILAANTQIGARPIFRTIGAPQPEVFHVSTSEIDITEGLVKQCQTDTQLAAILCNELGKLVAEREALAGPQARSPEREPPQEVRIGTDNAGSFGPADQTHLAELAKFDKRRRGPAAPPSPPPDPQVLARAYLSKAGYSDKDLDAAAPLLQAAAANSSLEKQLTPTAPARPWIH
jgi:hypothetical protein